MNWYTRRIDQGQTVEVSYAYDSQGGAYKRVHDRGELTTQFYFGELDWDREPEGTDCERAPCVEEWVPVDAVRED